MLCQVITILNNNKISEKIVVKVTEKPSRCFQALAGETVHFLGIKAKSFLPYFKAVGQELEMSDFNISDVVAKLSVKLQHSTVLNTNHFPLIWFLVAYKRNVNTVSLFLGGCWATERY